jgi:hypothetical protein
MLHASQSSRQSSGSAASSLRRSSGVNGERATIGSQTSQPKGLSPQQSVTIAQCLDEESRVGSPKDHPQVFEARKT